MTAEPNFEISVLEGEIEGTEKMIEDISQKIVILENQKNRLTYVLEVFNDTLKGLSESPQQGVMTLESSSCATES
tara:strand:- start:333 stop:557 length:225 start_codon:yes stop_codon:yes gene_type:complete